MLKRLRHLFDHRLLKKKYVRYSLITGVAFFAAFILLDLLFPFKPDIHYSSVVTASDGTVLHAFLNDKDKWRMKVEIDEISPQLENALIAKEDKYFYYHLGVNPAAIVRAVINNIRSGKKTSGASTITMQVARLLAPKKRSYSNKLIEMFRALQLEWHYSKREILQMYVNLLPYGGNIEGVKSASVLYYGKLPQALSPAQITVLTIIPNRPISLRPDRNADYLVKERNKWLKRFKKAGVFTFEESEDALSEPTAIKRKPVPKTAPHLSRRMKSIHTDKAIIKTTIDPKIQHKAEKLAYNYIRRLKPYNINNAAVIITDNLTGVIKAYVGSSDFNDTDYAGQVDGVKAVRSPGSTLKPLVYALAFDQGILTPKKIITDVPIDFSGYSPTNFDDKFNGKVTVEKALERSLNIPAVKALAAVGLPDFIEKLKKADFQSVTKNKDGLGLSVILGGCGATLEELTGLYSAFSREGIYIRPHYLQGQKSSPKTPLVSPEAAYVITDILSRLTRPDLPNGFQNSYHVPKISWKTGTSYGRRDAWSIGYNKKYTVGVWVGNFSGEGAHKLTGASIAVPLLFEIFNTIDYNSAENRFLAPENLKFRLVCTESGAVPDEFCENQVTDYYLPLISSGQKCRHLKEVFISADEAYAYCITCLPETGYKKKQFQNIPPELIDYYEAHGIAHEKIPEHNPECTLVTKSGASPRITSPSPHGEYLIDPNENAELMLSCIASDEVNTVYWYINDRFYKSAEVTEKVFFKPQPGTIKISCSDDRGRNNDIRITVKQL